MCATNATVRVISPASARREAAAAETVAAGVKEASAAAARNVTNVTDLVILRVTVKTVLTVATGATGRATSPKTVIRAPTRRRATTATSPATSPARVRRLPTILMTGVSRSRATTATRWGTYRGTVRRTLRHAMSATSPATSAVIVIRIVGSKQFLLNLKKNALRFGSGCLVIFKSRCCNRSQYLYPLDITTMQSDKALLGSNVHSPFLSGLH